MFLQRPALCITSSKRNYIKRMKYILLLCMTTSSLFVNAQDFIALYSDSVPNSIAGPDHEKSETTGGIERISKVRNPGISIFLPASDIATGEAGSHPSAK